MFNELEQAFALRQSSRRQPAMRSMLA